MKAILIILVFFGYINMASAQVIIFDENHFRIVNENGAMRSFSELSYQESLGGIKKNTDDIAVHTASLAMVQTIIHRSLTEVNEALKDAIQIKQMGRTIQQIYATSDMALDLASADPVLLLFAETYIKQAKERSVALLADVSNFILSEGNDVLINHNVRDELIGKVRIELQLIHAYMLAVKNSMYWAKMNGVLKKLNPYQSYLNQDINLINQILFQKKLLTR